MRLSVIKLTYPVWADLVPDLVPLIDRYSGVTRVSQQTLGGTHCFTLEMIETPLHFDPLRNADGPAQDLNELAMAMQQRCIPHDVERIDLDRPWRETRHLAFFRVTPDMSLEEHENYLDLPPLSLTLNATANNSNIANVAAACMLTPSEALAEEELAMIKSTLPTLSEADASHLLIAAAKLSRVESHFLPLQAAGLIVNERVFDNAFTQLTHSADFPGMVLANLQKAHAAWVYRALAQKLGIPEPAAAGVAPISGAHTLGHTLPSMNDKGRGES